MDFLKSYLTLGYFLGKPIDPNNETDDFMNEWRSIVISARIHLNTQHLYFVFIGMAFRYRESVLYLCLYVCT